LISGLLVVGTAAAVTAVNRRSHVSTKPDELITIDLADLDDVSGGATDQQLQDVLTGIQSTIKGLADQRSSGGITFDQFMTFLVFMRNGAFSGSSSGGGGGIACGCGCGGRGRCCRR
jgi:hypothetical protein